MIAFLIEDRQVDSMKIQMDGHIEWKGWIDRQDGEKNYTEGLILSNFNDTEIDREIKILALLYFRWNQIGSGLRCQ